MIDKKEQAELLLEAMPYIKKYQDKYLVIKYGGNAMTSEELKAGVMRDLTLLRFVGIKVVLVHGGGPEISQTLTRMGIESRFVGGLRYTDKETAEVVRIISAGWAAKRWGCRVWTECFSAAKKRARSWVTSVKSRRLRPTSFAIV